MKKTITTILFVIVVLGGLRVLAYYIGGGNPGLTQTQRDEAKMQVNVEACVEEAEASLGDNPNNLDARRYCGCVMEKVVDKVGFDGLENYTNDDGDQIIKDFYPEIKECVNQQIKEA